MMDQMLKTSWNKPVLTVDLKRKRLRLYKHVLRLLNYPEYVQFLINPEKKLLVVMRSDENDLSPRKLYWTTLSDSHQCCEFYCKIFVEALQKAFYRTGEEKTYRLIGRFNERKKYVVFDFGKSEPIEYEAEAVET
ncbi:MAG: hypothetical protein IK078_00120 [Lachnospiraceae bacterium]|nr:hypothetical protein [Lachnospiraceae bacterium]